MRNKLKGITLVETILYIGLFSIIIIIVLNFMLSTQEANQRTDNRLEINRVSEFVSKHINSSFNKNLSIDSTTSVFNDNQGVLSLIFIDGNRQYTLTDSQISFDGTPITPTTVSVTRFNLIPIYKGTDTIVGIKTEITFISKKDSSITETINLLSLIR
ncbi:MAG TPA: hypothetical protein PKH06_03030 [Candidatus Dojkabacteria bacterium]|nr:hypothetical protein [Candidatus Dojkabacteria bacterium]